jgi:ATP adenylyltransferase
LVDLPFTYFSAPLPPSPSPAQLHDLYLTLYQEAVEASGGLENDSKLVVDTSSPATISYNLAMTKNVLVLCPRQTEGIKVTSIDGHEIGPIALNGTLLGGTLLVKTEAEWLALRNDATKLGTILAAIGIPSKSRQH